jgi:hypothetical protein
MNTTYVYKLSEPNLYTVGYYDPIGRWYPESDFATRLEAAARVHYLNGGASPETIAMLEKLVADLERMGIPPSTVVRRAPAPRGGRKAAKRKAVKK